MLINNNPSRESIFTTLLLNCNHSTSAPVQQPSYQQNKQEVHCCTALFTYQKALPLTPPTSTSSTNNSSVNQQTTLHLHSAVNLHHSPTQLQPQHQCNSSSISRTSRRCTAALHYSPTRKPSYQPAPQVLITAVSINNPLSPHSTFARKNEQMLKNTPSPTQSVQQPLLSNVQHTLLHLQQAGQALNNEV